MKTATKRPGGKRGRVRSTPKGRRVDPIARAEVIALLGDAPRRRDLLIEHLHKIQDRYHCLSAPHLVALAAEMKLSMAEVYEVATFYHHFDIVKDGEAPPAPMTVRVCESIACHIAGADALLHDLKSRLGENIRVVAAPCIGMCDVAPAAIVGKNSVGNITSEAVVQTLETQHTDPRIPLYLGYEGYRERGGYQRPHERVVPRTRLDPHADPRVRRRTRRTTRDSVPAESRHRHESFSEEGRVQLPGAGLEPARPVRDPGF